MINTFQAVVFTRRENESELPLTVPLLVCGDEFPHLSTQAASFPSNVYPSTISSTRYEYSERVKFFNKGQYISLTGETARQARRRRKLKALHLDGYTTQVVDYGHNHATYC